MALERKQSTAPKGHVKGLAVALANNEICRGQILGNHTLLRWPNPKTTGVISHKSSVLNKAVMMCVAEILCPQTTSPLGLKVGPLKAEARLTNI